VALRDERVSRDRLDRRERSLVDIAPAAESVDKLAAGRGVVGVVHA